MRCGVLGRPVAHSLSPAMHRAAYARLGLDGWTYDAHEVAEADLEAFLDGLDDSWRGLSLTMPLKRAVLGMLDDVSPLAAEVGAANTVVLTDGRRVGDNTDVPGVTAAMAERGVGGVRTARLLGGGATAASVLAALAAGGLERAEVVVRDVTRAAEVVALGTRLGVDVDVLDLAHEHTGVVDLLVSTVPGASVADRAPTHVSRAGAVFDVLYDPWPTPVASAAEAAGVPVVTGLDLLAHQAVLQVGLMTGREVSADALRVAALEELGSR
ncbi:shikimate dehydrogenase [Solicola sp. PLA-1-18]|uniref:shikimate dehydrogenase n=1 Tax=Solicola sp. PLA-1-18 TaxID=3380532 RepID=UPI003B7C9BB0